MELENAGKGRREGMGRSKIGTKGKRKVLLTLPLSHLEKPHLLLQLQNICASKYKVLVEMYSNKLNGIHATHFDLATLGLENASCTLYFKILAL